MASGAHSRASPSSPAHRLPRARRDVVASRRAARGPSRARLPAPPPRATPVAEAEGTPSPRATPSAGAGAASPPAPASSSPRRRSPPAPAGASSSSPPSSSPSRASSADAFRPELAAELRRLGLELGECLDEGSYAAVFEATRLDASTEEEERRAKKDDAAPADAAADAASAASASDPRNAPPSSARSSAGVDAWAAAEGSTRFAVKILSSSKAKSPDAVRDFKREALLLARVDHPGIVRMHHFAALPESGDAFMVSELCAGGNVWNAVKSERATCGAMRERERRRAERADEPEPEPEPAAALASSSSSSSSSDADALDALDALPDQMPLLNLPALALDLAEALAYLHASGFAHRDVKSSNVLLKYCASSRRVRAKLCDFGSAAPVGTMPRRPARRRASGPLAWLGGARSSERSWRPVGSMLWMAPEMLAPPAEDEAPPEGFTGDAADVYALGVVVWEMMTRRVPWVLGDVSRAEVVDAVVRRGERLPLPEGIDPKLAAALESAWAPRPADRPSAAAIADALRAAGAEGWGEEGAFAAAAPLADARGREVVAALGEEARAEDEERGPFPEADAASDASAASASEAEAGPSETDTSAAEKKTPPASTREGVGSSDGEEKGDVERSDGATSSDDDAFEAAAEGGSETSARRVASTRSDPSGWFGAAGSGPDAAALAADLASALYPHVSASASDAAARKKALAAKRSECEALERKAEELKLRSKTDPFAAFTADAKAREARRRRREVELETAESEANDWRATREVLEKALRRAEKEHGEARRRYRDASRGKGA